MSHDLRCAFATVLLSHIAAGPFGIRFDFLFHFSLTLGISILVFSDCSCPQMIW